MIGERKDRGGGQARKSCHFSAPLSPPSKMVVAGL